MADLIPRLASSRLVSLQERPVTSRREALRAGLQDRFLNCWGFERKTWPMNQGGVDYAYRSEPCATLRTMARLGRGLAALFVVGIIGLLIWAFVRGVEANPAVVGPISTALLGFAGLVYQRSRERSQELERSHRAEMSPIYEQLVETIQSIDEFAARPDAEQVAFFKGIASKLTLHGPSPVIRTWIAWLRALALQPLSVPLHAQERLLLAIREDLGLNSNALKRGDLVRLYLLEEDTDESREIWRNLRSGRETGQDLDL